MVEFQHPEGIILPSSFSASCFSNPIEYVVAFPNLCLLIELVYLSKLISRILVSDGTCLLSYTVD